MGERETPGAGPPPAAVACPRCGGVVRREGLRVEEARAPCPFCGHALDLSAPAPAARGAPLGRAPADDLACPRCGAAVEEDAVELLNGLARCGHCTTVLDLSAGRNAAWYRRRMEEKEGVPLPRTFRVTRSLGSVTLEWRAWGHRWRQVTGVANAGGLFRHLLLSALGILTVLTVTAVVWPTGGYRPVVAGGWLLLLVPVVPLVVVRRRAAVVGGALRTGWWPFPRGHRTVAAREIRQLFVAYRDVDLDDGVDDPGVERILAFDLMAVGPGGERSRLLGPFAERDEALFLERWIERRLGIGERHVDGEMLLRGPGKHG